MTADQITPEMIEAYQRDGFIRVPQVLPREAVIRYREQLWSYAQAVRANGSRRDSAVFLQIVNIWLQNPDLRHLTLNDSTAQIAQRLTGVKLRLWHDHALIKGPLGSAPTHFHQDHPYWSHACSNAISCWLALVDVPARKGCMSFIPGSHRRRDLAPQNLTDPNSLFDKAPEMEWEPKVTLPLRAGDCTFHSSYCAHMANANETPDHRIAHIMIYMDADATFIGGRKHVCTHPLNLSPGQVMDHPHFPLVDEFPRVRETGVVAPADAIAALTSTY